MESIETEAKKKNKNSDIDDIIKECNKSCMECLQCPYNKNSQFNLILQGLFNSGKNIDEIKGKEINSSCSLN